MKILSYLSLFRSRVVLFINNVADDDDADATDADGHEVRYIHDDISRLPLTDCNIPTAWPARVYA